MPETASTPAQRWSSLPEHAQATALSLLARMITDGVVNDAVDAVEANDDGDR